MKLGPRYLKSLALLEKGPLNIDGRTDIVRYKNLEKMGLCQGTGVRVVGLTPEGKRALKTGQCDEESPASVAAADADMERIFERDRAIPPGMNIYSTANVEMILNSVRSIMGTYRVTDEVLF